MTNVLYLSYDGMTDPLGQSQVLPYLKGLSKAGYTIHLISFEKEERFAIHKAHIQSICDLNGIVWHPQRYTKKPPLFSTLKDVRKMRKLAYSLNKKYSFSIVHCRSYISALVGLKMKEQLNTKFVFDMRGFWADERIEGGIWNIKNPIFKTTYNYFKRKELEFFKQADHIISLTDNGKKEILSWKGLEHRANDISVIPCCVDLELFNPDIIDKKQQETLRNSLGIETSDFVLGYVGSIGTWYMLDEMLDFFKVLAESKPQSKFLFVTGENPSTILLNAKEKDISPEQIVITSTLHKGVPIHISLFDYSIFFIRPTFSKKASSPTKQGEIMAMGVPLICNSGVGDTDKIVKETKSGYLLENLDSATYKNFVSKLEVADLKQTSQLIIEAERFYSLTMGINIYISVYKTLID